MRLLTTAGVLVFSAGTVFGAYIVDLDGGDRMTVDSYWEEGERMHLVRGGIDLSVPMSRVRGVRPAEGGDDSAGVGQEPAPAPAAPHAAAEAVDPERKELETKQRRIEHHLLRVQQERFEARNRGEPEQRLQRLDKEFRRTQKRWGTVHRARESQDQ